MTLKSFILSFLFFSVIQFSFAQQDSINFDEVLNAKIKRYQKQLASEELSQKEFDFIIDTMKVETRLQVDLESDYSTSGMVNATYQAEESYDKLLNKYYKILYARLNKKDKAVLKKAQLSWLSFRDNERLLFQSLSDEAYSGGGSIQRVFSSHRYLTLTKDRVIQLAHYYLYAENL
ncbi:lysozyme inhibitor LprI family protein [Sphingobacterium hungaricum]